MTQGRSTTSETQGSVDVAAVALAHRGEPLLRVRDVHRRFGTRVALDGVDLDVYAGESVGLVGESGSGKTTLARMLVGLTRADAGRVDVAGVDLAQPKLSRGDWTTVRSTVQMAFQDPYSTLNPARSVGSILRESLHLAAPGRLDDRVEKLLGQVGLSGDYARRRPSQLSGGERQRVAVARALGRQPRVLVCDEVVSALDISIQAHILNLLSDLRDQLGLTLVFITHDLAVVRQISDRVYVLHRGRVVENGPTARVLDRPEHDYTRALLDAVPTWTGQAGGPSSPTPRGTLT